MTSLDPRTALITQSGNPSHGPRGSLHPCLCMDVLAPSEFQTMPIHHYKVGLVVMEPRTTTGGLTPTLAQSSLCKSPRDLHLPDQLTDSESCVALCRQCRPYLLVALSLLKQGQEETIIREMFPCTGGHDHKTYTD